MSSENDPNLDNLKAIAEGIGAIDEQIKALTAKKKQLEEQLRPAIAGRGPCVFGEYIIEVKTQPGRKTLDKEKIMAAGLDPEIFMKVGKPFTSMSIKKVTVA